MKRSFFAVCTITLLGLAAILPGCQFAQDALEALLSDSDAPKGAKASSVLKRRTRSGSTTNVAAAMKLMESEERQQSGATTDADIELPTDQVAFLKKNNGSRLKFKDEFTRIDVGTLNTSGKTVGSENATSLGGFDQKFVISNLPRMPVRNQGGRGTCASFAGIGHLESFFLKKYPQLPSLDLAEQYFYYSAKPFCLESSHSPKGCRAGSEEGSLSEDGYNASIKMSGFDLMSEDSCPYNPQRGANDIQYEMVEGQCVGNLPIAHVKAIDYVDTAQQILDYVQKKDTAVVIYTKLSDNWIKTNGLVTLKDAGPAEDNPHAGGHAYLVVGAKPINMPSEGNLCFIVKNSWSAGWGLEGMTCITLAWFNQYRFKVPFPVVTDAELSPEFLAKFGPNPSPTPGPTPNPTPPPDPTPNPSPPPAAFTKALLQGDDGDWYETELKAGAAADKVVVRGILENDSPTNELELDLAKDRILFKGVEVGRIFKEQLTLCTADYSEACQLSYIPAEGGLKIEFMQFAERTASMQASLEQKPDTEWKDLVKVTSNFGMQVTDAKQGIGLRLVDGNKKPSGKPLGLHLDVTTGQIITRGQTVGEVGGQNGFDICTGNFKNSCRFVVGGESLLNLFVRK